MHLCHITSLKLNFISITAKYSKLKAINKIYIVIKINTTIYILIIS